MDPQDATDGYAEGARTAEGADADGAEAERLRREAARLLALVRGREGRWWSAAGREPAGRALAERLAALAREAGSGAPPGAAVPPVRAHGLSDLLALLVADLLATGPRGPVAAAAADALRDASAVLPAPPAGRVS